MLPSVILLSGLLSTTLYTCAAVGVIELPVLLLKVIAKVFAAETLHPTIPKPACAVGLLIQPSTSPARRPLTVKVCSAVVLAKAAAGVSVTEITDCLTKLPRT